VAHVFGAMYGMRETRDPNLNWGLLREVKYLGLKRA
jgi:hypothetical protein